MSSVEIFETSGFFVLRSPLLPFDDFVRWGNWLTGTWEADVERLRTRLRVVIDQPEIRHALLVASPSLVKSIPYWEQDPDSKRGVQTERSLVRYFARMCGRATPFGPLAGWSTGRIAEETGAGALSLQSRQQYRLKSRLDYGYLHALSVALRAASAINTQLRYWPNSSLARIGAVWHYRETKIAGDRRFDELVTLQTDQYIETVIERARNGATIAELTSALQADGISEADATEYVSSLLAAQVVTSTLEPLVTGYLPLDDLMNQLAALPNSDQLAMELGRARAALAAIDQHGLSQLAEAYEEATRLFEGISLPVRAAPLFQVEMIKPFALGVLPAAVVHELSDAIQFLCTGGIIPAEEPRKIRAFREAFKARYGRAWVPLVEALDEESGIGFGQDSASSSQRRFTAFDSILVQKLVECSSRGETEVVLDAADFASKEVFVSSLPDAFSIRASIVAPSIESVLKGDFRIHLLSAAGPSGVTLLGRFCHADPELEKHVGRHLRQEEAHQPDAVYAEIVYLPNGKVGNIVSRPVLREYEIVYLGRSGTAQDHQIPVDDLLVAVTEDERVLLYSRKLKKMVIPRLTTAHAFSDSGLAPLYQFLCYLQYQPRTNVPLVNWGPLEDLLFLPRIRRGRVILSAARWKILPNEVKRIAIADRSQSFTAVQALRRDRRLPRWVLYSEENRSLPVDLDNPLSVDAFVHVLKRSGTGRVVEMCPGPDELCVVGPEGRFQHELIVPFIRRPCGGQRRAITTNSVVSTAIRTAPPGGSWLYVKLYGAPTALDDLLTTMVLPFARAVVRDGLALKWFFVRYEDPEAHLRIRFHGSPILLRRELFPRLVSVANPQLNAKALWKIQFDTYDREIERYGGPKGVATAESVFYADSEAVVAILGVLKRGTFSGRRLQVAALGVDQLFRDFGFDWGERQVAVTSARDFVAKRLLPDAAFKKRLAEAFRTERGGLEALLLGPAAPAFWEAYELRSRFLAPLIKRLQRLERDGHLTRNVREIVPNYIHMHVNRMMASTAAVLEYTLYDFLLRLYTGWLATGTEVRCPSLRSPTEVKDS